MVIAEVGLNHCGIREYALFYMKKVLQTKCDGITYQIREPSFYPYCDQPPGGARAQIRAAKRELLAIRKFMARTRYPAWIEKWR